MKAAQSQELDGLRERKRHVTLVGEVFDVGHDHGRSPNPHEQNTGRTMRLMKRCFSADAANAGAHACITTAKCAIELSDYSNFPARSRTVSIY
jgi:hypothetical protein